MDYEQAQGVSIGIHTLCVEAHTLAIQKGWYEQDRSVPELLALIHSEVSECLEGARHGNPPDEHCPAFSSCEIELADAVIRICDMAAAQGWDLGNAIIAKHKFNETRAVRHGGKKF